MSLEENDNSDTDLQVGMKPKAIVVGNVLTTKSFTDSLPQNSGAP